MIVDLRSTLDRLYLECEHGDIEHRKWLKDKFDAFADEIEKERMIKRGCDMKGKPYPYHNNDGEKVY